ncbi:flavodoxin family protein [Acetobacterium wieringae]|uniref:flavodoxin family protein n=1 Tax=Acetobacterium wieringae TaxID=52694 RepID=UPI0020337810|nr:flavodoxin family protein [Acetobacterium wieringae]URN84380.1 flavodoxin family protein [Acetobacterium wieringae]
MGKKILIITGSPRPNGNTNTLVAAFMAGAVASGNEVQIFDAVTRELNPCHGDCSCFERGYCMFKDDGVKLHELMGWADVLVFASPIYWKGFTSQMKRVIDRFNPYNAPKGRASCSVTETYLISAAITPEINIFNAVSQEFVHLNEILNFKICDELLVPGVEKINDIQKKPEYIKKAVEMGYRIGQSQLQEEEQNIENTIKKSFVDSPLRRHQEGCWLI